MTDTAPGPSVGVRVDHVGLAVRDVSDAEPLLGLLGAEKLIEETVADEGFTWAYYELGDASRIELIEPAGGESFLTHFLDEHGPGLHHVTLEVGDLDAVVSHLEAHGVDVVDHAEREGYAEAFVSPRSAAGALFQLMEYHADYVDRGAELLIGGERLSSRESSSEPT